jgi:hypothetical protein
MAENLEQPIADSAEKAYAAAAESAPVEPPAAKAPPVVEAPLAVAAPRPAKSPAKPAVPPVVTMPAKARKTAAKPASAAPKKPSLAAKKPVKAKKAVTAKKAVASRPAKVPVAAKPVVAKAAARPNPKTNPLTALKETLMPAKKKTVDFTAKLKSVTADVQTKAKAAYATGSELAAEAGDFTKGNVDALVASGKILGAGMQDLGKGYVAEGKASLETLKADVKELTTVKSPVEFVRVQTAILRRNLDHAFELGGKNSEAALKLASEAIAPLSERANLAIAKFKKAA